MEDLVFRLAGKEDVEAAFGIVQAAIAGMRKLGIEQWDELYPDREILEEDAEKGQLRVGFLGERAACIYVLNQECDEEYQDGRWEYPDAEFYVLHRLCVDPYFQKQGVGTAALRHFEEEAHSLGADAVRLDVFSLNPFALRMYEANGYRRVGHADWRKGRFYLMEKKL